MSNNTTYALSLCENARRLILDGDFDAAEGLLRQAIGTDMTCFPAYRYLEFILDSREEYAEATRLHYFMRFAKLGIALYPFMKSDIFDPSSEFAEIILDEGFAKKISLKRRLTSEG
ncbi:MAG: hypothetical protein AB1750_01995 [Chloroflexota bacterium]